MTAVVSVNEMIGTCCECACEDGECYCSSYCNCEKCAELCFCEPGYEQYPCESCSAPDGEYLRDLLNDGYEDPDDDPNDEDGAQREKLYEWERKTFGKVWMREDLTLNECQRLVDACFRRYTGSNRGALVGPSKTTCAARHDHEPRPGDTQQRIWLPRWGRNKVVVLHETAHAISLDEHGPRFARVFIDLLADEGFGEVGGLAASAKAAGVKVAARRELRSLGF